MSGLRNISITLLISLFFLQSCSKHRAAPVEDLSNSKSKKYSKRSYNKSRNTREYKVVKKGDTLYSIGFANNIDYKKLAILNNIKPPYRIYPGQKIKLKGKVTVLKKTPKKITNNPVAKSVKPPSVVVKTNKATTSIPPKVTKKPPNPNVSTKTPVTKKAVAKPQKKPPVKAQSNTTPASNTGWVWPVKGRILSSFSSTDTSRKGIKIAVNYGKPVYASNNGTVVYSGDGLRGYGELIIIKHSNNLLSAYAHNSKRFVKEGQTVNQGQEIAKSGKGNDGKPLLHFEIRKNGQPVNPLNYLPK